MSKNLDAEKETLMGMYRNMFHEVLKWGPPGVVLIGSGRLIACHSSLMCRSNTGVNWWSTPILPPVYRRSSVDIFRYRRSTGSIHDIFENFAVDRLWSAVSTVFRVDRQGTGGLLLIILDLTAGQPPPGLPKVIRDDRNQSRKNVRVPVWLEINFGWVPLILNLLCLRTCNISYPLLSQLFCFSVGEGWPY